MITLTSNNQIYQIYSKTSVSELAKQHHRQNIVGCILNGKVHDLNYQIKKSGSFEWIEENSKIGALMKERTLTFLFVVAVRHILNTTVHVRHTLASGLYITIDHFPVLSDAQIQQITNKMNQMIQEDVKIQRKVVLKEEAVAHFQSLGRNNLAKLLSQRTSLTSSIYTCDGVDDYYYGVMATHAGLIQHFTLLPYRDGVWLSLKDELIDQPKLFEVFKRFETRGQATGISYVSDLNEAITQGRLAELIAFNEQRISDDLDQIVQMIHKQSHTKVIFIAGPSSAGKTTFSKRLAEKLTALGHPTRPLSMDDFFKNRVDSPRLPDGSYDYENIECVDLNLFNHSMNALLRYESVQLPVYDFTSGEKYYSNEPIQLKENELLIVEGIHALNPRSYAMLERDQIFKIYINALTHLNYDTHNRIATSDYRMIRRMIRDHQFRNRHVAETIEGWHKVRDGEDQYIYPYQEEADVVFNTSMDYELSVIKTRIMPLLDAIPIDHPEYIEANRIRKLLAYFVEGDPELVPANSILKEFLGGSIYQ